mgnify:CR=1 FL=1
MNTYLTGIDHIQIAAPQRAEDSARKFYGELLGMTEIPKPDNLKGRGGCWFQCGSHEVHIGIQTDFSPAKKAHPGFIVNALEQLKSQLHEEGYSISEEPPIGGSQRFFTRDQFGNRLEVIEFK